MSVIATAELQDSYFALDLIIIFLKEADLEFGKESGWKDTKGFSIFFGFHGM